MKKKGSAQCAGISGGREEHKVTLEFPHSSGGDWKSLLTFQGQSTTSMDSLYGFSCYSIRAILDILDILYSLSSSGTITYH